MSIKRLLLLILAIIVLVFLIQTRLEKAQFMQIVQNLKYVLNRFQDSVHDFPMTKCENMVRVGGNKDHVKAAPDKLYRIDGAWYVCVDKNIEPKVGDCTVLSFGISEDPSFDIAINKEYKCTVHSFDPNIEAPIIKKMRQQKPQYSDTVMVPLTDNWMFHKVGLVGYESERNKYEKGAFLSFPQMLKQLKLENIVIDVLKIDIEHYEWDVIITMDMDYLCKYVKQFCLETHISAYEYIGLDYEIMKKLEKCFLLFHRNHRFFDGDTFGKTGHLSEWQSREGYELAIEPFKDNLDIAKHMFTYGELYFLNRNFI